MSTAHPADTDSATTAADMTDDNTADRETSGDGADIPFEEATSAADADWLAELRATARQRNTTLAEVVSEAEPDTTSRSIVYAHADADTVIETDAVSETEMHGGFGTDDALDDEVTIGSPTALDDIRRLAREERRRAAATDGSSAAAPTDITAEPAQSEVRATEPATSPRSTPDTPPVIRPAAPRIGADTETSVPRWEAPPRLEAAPTADAPGFLERSRPQGGPDWRITVLAVAVALLLGVVIALVFFRGGSTEPLEENPDNTTLVDGSPVLEAPAETEEGG